MYIVNPFVKPWILVHDHSPLLTKFYVMHTCASRYVRRTLFVNSVVFVLVSAYFASPDMDLGKPIHSASVKIAHSREDLTVQTIYATNIGFKKF